MTNTPTITDVECIEFNYPIENMEAPQDSFYPGYSPGGTFERTALGIRIHTNGDAVGEYVSLNSPPGPALAQIQMIAPYLVGKNPLDREQHWNHFRLVLRKYDRFGIGPIDIALWDLAGKHSRLPVHALLGTYCHSLPTYASTAFGSESNGGGLDTPKAYADFAADCLELGFPAFKIHGWRAQAGQLNVGQEIEAIHAVGERVGDEMDLMYDAVGQLESFGDALKAGQACDEQNYFWYEDPNRDFGTSQHGSKRLRDLLDTPLLQTEHIRGFESHTDYVANAATDFVRADPEYDAGSTGAMKIGRMAEGFGLDVELHAPGPAQRHCMAALRNTNYYELALVHPDHQTTHDPPIYENGYSDSIEAVDSNGELPVPDGSGVGVSYNWDYIEKNQTRSISFD